MQQRKYAKCFGRKREWNDLIWLKWSQGKVLHKCVTGDVLVIWFANYPTKVFNLSLLYSSDYVHWIDDLIKQGIQLSFAKKSKEGREGAREEY